MDFIYSFISDGMDTRPAYGFSHRLRAAVAKQNDNPSPLDYQPQISSINSSKGFSFGHRPRTNYVKDYDLPGPGEYTISNDIPVPRPRNLTGQSFGMKTWYKRPLSHSPGPKYNTRDIESSQGRRGFSFGHRGQFYHHDEDIPGPGEYESQKFLYKNTPAYSFGVKNYGRRRSENMPAPSDYHTSQMRTQNKTSKPGYVFGTETRGRAFKASNWNPGPGNFAYCLLTQ